MLDHLFRCTVTWLAPMLPFTAEEAWLSRYPCGDGSVHLELFPERARRLARRRAGREMAQGAHWCAASSPARWRSSARTSASAPRWKRRPSSTSPTPTCSPRWSTSTSPRSASPRPRPWSKARVRRTRSGSTTCSGVAVGCRARRGHESARARGRSSPSVGSDPDYPDVSPRDAQALREWDAMRKAAE